MEHKYLLAIIGVILILYAIYYYAYESLIVESRKKTIDALIHDINSAF